MKQVLRGNFETQRPVQVADEKATLEAQFEKEAMKRLGGSIAFVSKKHFLWTGDDDKNDGGTQ